MEREELESSNRRSRVEILADILEVIAKGDTGPTKIMFKTNISWLFLQKSLNLLASSEMLIEESRGSKKVYRLTSKGHKFLSDYMKVREELLTTNVK